MHQPGRSSSPCADEDPDEQVMSALLECTWGGSSQHIVLRNTQGPGCHLPHFVSAGTRGSSSPEHRVIPHLEIQALCIMNTAECLGIPPPKGKAPHITRVNYTYCSLSFFKAAARVFPPGHSERAGNFLRGL